MNKTTLRTTQLLVKAKEIARNLFLETNYETSPLRSDTQYVTDLYYAYLQRGPDAGGLGWWVPQAAGSVQNRINVLNAFEASGEFQTLVNTLYGTATSDGQRTENYVTNLYQGALSRPPNSSELSTNSATLNSAAGQGQSQVISAAETMGRNLFAAQVNDASLSNTQFVTNLYEGFLQRGPDASGLGFWSGQASVGQGRQNVLNAFATSSAFRELAGTLYREVYWLVADHLGTPRMVVNKSGSLASVKRHDYLPFGEELGLISGRTTVMGYSSTDNVRQKFTSKERDNETGLDYFLARYYSSTQGRFTSPDDFLNDTHVDDPASWNLYVYVRNNPLRFVDPSGEEVYSTNLSDEEKKKLIEDWQKKIGYQNVYFDKNNKLVIDTKAGFQGGSAKARDQLSAAVNSTDIRFNLKSVDTTKVAFAEVDAGTTIISSGKTIRTDYTVSLDFHDFKNAVGDGSAKGAYSVGITAIHEFDHKLYNISDYPNGPTDPGPLERTYINPIRQELGLPERVFYTSRPVDAAFKSFYPGGGQQLNFQLNGKAKVIRWRNDLVGGKVKD